MTYNPDCDTPTEVYINGERIPASDVDIHIRTEGPMSINYYVEGSFASPFNGEDFTSLFGSSDPDDQDKWDICHVKLRDSITGEYTTNFHGLVTGMGNDGSGNERMWHFRAQGPGMLSTKIPAKLIFSSNNTLEFNMKLIRNEIENKTQLNVELEFIGSVDDYDPTATESSDGVTADDEVVVPDPTNDDDGDNSDNGDDGTVDANDKVVAPDYESKDGLLGERTFQPNKHTIRHVFEWIERKLDVTIWFRPEEDKTVIVVANNPNGSLLAHYLEGNARKVKVVQNNAVSELKPVNTLVTKGGATQSYGSDSISADTQFYTAKVAHKELLDRAGGKEYHGDIHHATHSESSNAVKNESIRELRKRIQETTGGDMMCLLTGDITPFYTIAAKPTCAGIGANDDSVIIYQISRIHHQIRPGRDREEDTRTQLNVGISVNEDDITLLEGSWKAA